MSESPERLRAVLEAAGVPLEEINDLLGSPAPYVSDAPRSIHDAYIDFDGCPSCREPKYGHKPGCPVDAADRARIEELGKTIAGVIQSGSPAGTERETGEPWNAELEAHIAQRLTLGQGVSSEAAVYMSERLAWLRTSLLRADVQFSELSEEVWPGVQHIHRTVRVARGDTTVNQEASLASKLWASLSPGQSVASEVPQTTVLPSSLRTPGQMEWIQQRFTIDGLERLARSTQDYYDTHGWYLPDVSALAHAALVSLQTAVPSPSSSSSSPSGVAALRETLTRIAETRIGDMPLREADGEGRYLNTPIEWARSLARAALESTS